MFLTSEMMNFLVVLSEGEACDWPTLALVMNQCGKVSRSVTHTYIQTSHVCCRQLPGTTGYCAVLQLIEQGEVHVRCT